MLYHEHGVLPAGEAVDNESINQYLGHVIGEGRVQKRILAVNGIQTRYYALDKKQNATHTLYELASEAVRDCLSNQREPRRSIISPPARRMRRCLPRVFPRCCTTS